MVLLRRRAAQPTLGVQSVPRHHLPGQVQPGQYQWSSLFQFTTKKLRDFIDPNHLVIQIDEQLDFAKLVAPLEERYCPDFGRPAIHPEVMVRALLIGSLYNIASFRRLCSVISENLAYR